MIEPREFAKASDVKEGDFLIADSGFDCIKPDAKLEVKANSSNELFVACNEGMHCLDGQLGGPFGGFHTRTHYVGFYKAWSDRPHALA